MDKCRIVPISAHAAFDKGAAYMGIKVHTIPINQETRQVDLKLVARAINPNTIMACALDLMARENCCLRCPVARWVCN